MISKTALAIFCGCVFLRWWIDAQILIDILRISAGVACVALIADK